ncbi:hypothetical protein CR162_16060 [Pseudoroseomonas rhizosphaerae]|uniref:Uncharacterized protein n=1 Tax=Teichococcus rhizosphaerae TaxID=1335062 RepID=A0A2C7A9A1_9PROT|nr:hypothetical protein [Pseudoroseomonas rhizosphaerae]PHK93935.1 hypothetical protein CR162_16060 [Pseudoroseomonas rhizosphaerae]
MRIETFARLLDTHGADPVCWPPASAAAARALLASSEEARALHRRALALASALDESLPGPDAETLARMRARLARAVAAAPLPEPPRAAPGGWLRPCAGWLRPLWPAGCGALVTLALCLLWLNLAPAPTAQPWLGAPPLLAMLELPE